MKMYKNAKKAILFFLIILACSVGRINVYANLISGEIINTSVEHKVAFTDLVAGDLKLGDVVEVLNGKEHVTYLKVLESSEVVSKLGFLQTEGFTTNIVDFNKIVVGSKVKRISANEKILDRSNAVAAVHQQQKLVEQLNIQLRDNSTKMNQLMNQNKQYESQVIELKGKLSLLKKKLEYLTEFLDEKIKMYEFQN